MKRYIPDSVRDAQSDPRFMDGLPIRGADSRARRPILHLPRPRKTRQQTIKLGAPCKD